MKLYDGGRAPNPRRVRIFLAEKGISVPTEAVDLGSMAHRSPAFKALNPLQRVPVLVLDDGAVVTELIAICRYFEVVQPRPVLFGATALEQAQVEMWNLRVEHNLLFPVTQAFRHLHPAMAKYEVPQIAAWGEANKARVIAFLAILDDRLAEHPFIAGSAYSIADISALVAIDFMKPARLELAAGFANIARWRAEVAARPSAGA